MKTAREASPELEAFIDESIRLSKERGYYPTRFEQMRRELKTIPAIARLVQNGDIQSGFTRMLGLGLLDWSIESAVIKFPEEFDRDALLCAEWRLQMVKGGG